MGVMRDRQYDSQTVTTIARGGYLQCDYDFNLKAQPLHVLKLTLVARSAEYSAQPIATTNPNLQVALLHGQSLYGPRAPPALHRYGRFAEGLPCSFQYTATPCFDGSLKRIMSPALTRMRRCWRWPATFHPRSTGRPEWPRRFHSRIGRSTSWSVSLASHVHDADGLDARPRRLGIDEVLRTPGPSSRRYSATPGMPFSTTNGRKASSRP